MSDQSEMRTSAERENTQMDIQDEGDSNTMQEHAHTLALDSGNHNAAMNQHNIAQDESMDTHDELDHVRNASDDSRKGSAQKRNPIQSETAQVEAMSSIVAQLNTSLKATHENIKMVFHPMSETENLVDAWINTLEKAHTFSTLMLHPDYRPNTMKPPPFASAPDSNSGGERTQLPSNVSRIPQLPR